MNEKPKGLKPKTEEPKPKTKILCEQGDILIDGECLKLDHESENMRTGKPRTRLVFNEDCEPKVGTREAYKKIATALAGDGDLEISSESWDTEPAPKRSKK